MTGFIDHISRRRPMFPGRPTSVMAQTMESGVETPFAPASGERSDPIQCVFALDDGYAPHLAVALASLLANNRDHLLGLHVIHAGLAADNIAGLVATCRGHANATLRFHEIDAQPAGGLRRDEHITLASYFRLFMAEALPSEVDRAIYLDSDVVVLGDIGELWRQPLGGNLIAAAPNLFTHNAERLGLPADHVYVNAGVLLVDLAGWRREDMFPAFLDFASRHRDILRFHDQDVLNVVLQTRIRYLDYRWNFQARTEYRHVAPLSLSEAEFRAMRRKPGIVHFTTGRKPWQFAHDVSFEREYLRYRKLTPWGSERQAGRTMVAMAKRLGKRALRPVRRAYRSFVPDGRDASPQPPAAGAA